MKDRTELFPVVLQDTAQFSVYDVAPAAVFAGKGVSELFTSNPLSVKGAFLDQVVVKASWLAGVFVPIVGTPGVHWSVVPTAGLE